MCTIKPGFGFLTCHALFVPDKSLKDTLDKVLLSGFFDRAQTHQNGMCEEEEEQEEQAVAAESASGKQSSEPGNYQHISRYVCEIFLFFFTFVSFLQMEQLLKNTQSQLKWKPQR